MKYIDAEKLIAEIERVKEIHEKNLKKPMERGRIGYAHGVVDCCDKILDFIDSLPKETNNGVDVTDFCKPIDPGIAQCVADHWWEMLDGKEPSESLEEAAEKYCEKINHRQTTIITDSFKAGAEWQKAQMMKEAEECDLYYDGDFLAIDLNMAALGYSERDKVRVIVIPNTGKNEHGTY